MFTYKHLQETTRLHLPSNRAIPEVKKAKNTDVILRAITRVQVCTGYHNV